MVAIDDCNFIFSTDCYDEGDGLSYSLDNGVTWSNYLANIDGYSNNAIHVTAGNKVLFKGHNLNVRENATCNLFPIISTTDDNTISQRFNVEGNIMSLLYGDNFINQTEIISPNNEYALAYLFIGDTGLINAENLILPATTLEENCYAGMFWGCTSLITVPELPATTLSPDCYYSMFRYCTSLTTAPELPATTLADGCYLDMFTSCTSLTTAPELPATTLTDYCYASMFEGCSSLFNAPELQATTLSKRCYSEMFKECTALITAPELLAPILAEECYYGMFEGCESLNSITCLATDISASSCTSGWVYGVSASGTFTKNTNMVNWATGNSGIPANWTIQDA